MQKIRFEKKNFDWIDIDIVFVLSWSETTEK